MPRITSLSPLMHFVVVADEDRRLRQFFTFALVALTIAATASAGGADRALASSDPKAVDAEAKGEAKAEAAKEDDGAKADTTIKTKADARSDADADAETEEDLEAREIEEEEALFEARQRWFIENRKGPDGRIPWDARSKARRALEENEYSGRLLQRTDATPSGVWVPFGPAPLLSGGVGWSGRVTSLAIAPGDPNTVYVGSAQGGVWKTTNGGTTWTPLSDSQATLAIGSIAIDPSNPSTIWVGTGEANGSCDSYFGAGILKSTDAGGTWMLLGAASFANTSISRLIVHPTTPSTLWASNVGGVGGFAAATCYGKSGTYGVWRSTDSGVSWTRVLGSAQTGGSSEANDLVIDPANPSILYAAVDSSGVWKTTNGGTSWAKLAGGLPASGFNRIDLAIDPNNALRVFASFSAGSFLGTWRTMDGGATWTQVSLPPSALCSTFCWYCLNVDVAPDGSIWLGGVGLWRSTDAGSTWDSVLNSGVHVDQHALAFGGGKVWAGNDGGVFVTTSNGSSWTSKNAGLQLTQFYPGASIDPASFNLAMAGAQDNGTSRYGGSTTWTMVGGGDGSFTAIDFTNPTMVQYASSQNLVISKTTNGFSFGNATAGLSDSGSGSAAFIAPYVMCPNNPSVLVAGSDNLWRTNNAAGSWTSNSLEALAGGNPTTAIAFAPSDLSCNTYFAGFLGGNVFRTTVGGGTTGWTNISSGLPTRVVSDLAVTPTNPNIVYATYSGYGGGHVFRTVNALAASPTWTSIDNGLPDTPVLAALVHPSDPNLIFLGTDLGVFRSLNGGASWQLFMDGLPNVAVYDLVASANPEAAQVVAFTHGRGAFRLSPFHAAQDGAAFQDTCPFGGPGSGNGVVDPGETVTMPVTLLNDGPGALTTITGALSTTSGGVTIQDGTATWPNLAIGASALSNPNHFTYSVAQGTACGATLDFSLSLVYDQGSNVSSLPVVVGDPPGPAPTPVSEAFAGTTPVGWSFVDGGQFGGLARTWSGTNPGSRTIGEPFDGSWEIVDSAEAGMSAIQNEQLTTPSFNASTCSSLRASFSNQFHWKLGGMNEIADVDVSTNGGGVWTNVLRMQGADDGFPVANTKTIDLTALAAGQPSVKLRFHYYNGQFEYWWAIDNVVVTCEQLDCHPCAAPAPPGEAGAGPLLTLQKNGANLALSWGAAAGGCGATDYALYQGTLASLHSGIYDHAPLGGGPSGCTSGGATTRHVPMPPGSGLYFLATALTPSAEGSYGRRSTGAERPAAASACRGASNLALCP